MKQTHQEQTKQVNQPPVNAISCGNCWGHQQYEQGYRAQKIDHWRDKKDNFISKFIKKYI